MQIDEVSLVDRPANQHAAVMIAKNFGGATMPEADDAIEIYDAEGQPISADTELEDGTTVFGADGTAYTWTVGDDEAAEAAEAAEMAEVGKAASPFRPASGAGREAVGKSLAQAFREELAKARTGNDVAAVVSKMSTALEAADARATNAEEIAKAERDQRLMREYIGKAAEYNLPVTPEELGPVLMRCESLLPAADCAVLNKVFNAAGSMLFTELGFEGGGTEDGSDPLAAVHAAAEEAVAKAGGQQGDHIAKAAAEAAFFETNTGAYDQYIASLR